MFARVTKIQLKTDTLDDAGKFFQESIVPAAKSQKGFHSVYLLSERKTGKGFTIAFWDSEEDIISNEKSGWWQEQVSKFKDFFAAPVEREIYEVIAQS